MTGRAAAGSAAHVVLEWGAPWSRQTHRFYPPAVRARVAELMRVAQAIKRGKAAYKVDGALVGYETAMSPTPSRTRVVKYVVASAEVALKWRWAGCGGEGRRAAAEGVHEPQAGDSI